MGGLCTWQGVRHLRVDASGLDGLGPCLRVSQGVQKSFESIWVLYLAVNLATDVLPDGDPYVNIVEAHVPRVGIPGNCTELKKEMRNPAQRPSHPFIVPTPPIILMLTDLLTELRT